MCLRNIHIIIYIYIYYIHIHTLYILHTYTHTSLQIYIYIHLYSYTWIFIYLYIYTSWRFNIPRSLFYISLCSHTPLIPMFLFFGRQIQVVDVKVQRMSLVSNIRQLICPLKLACFRGRSAILQQLSLSWTIWLDFSSSRQVSTDADLTLPFLGR